MCPVIVGGHPPEADALIGIQIDLPARDAHRGDTHASRERESANDHRCVDHARDMADPIDQIGELERPVPRRITRFDSGRDLRGQHIRRVESGIDLHHGNEAANEKCRANEKHDRQRHLDDHQRTPKPPPSGSCSAASAILQRGRQVWPRQLKRRNDTEQQAGDNRRSRGRGEHTQVDGNQGNARKIVRERVFEKVNTPRCDDDCAQSAGNREHQTLQHELANQPPSAGSECGANADLALARSRPGEQQVRNVRTGNEEDDADRTKQHQHPRPGTRTHHVVDERPHADVVVLVPVRVRLFDRTGHLVHLRLRPPDGDVRLESGDHLEVVASRGRIAHVLIRGHDVRNPDVGAVKSADRIHEFGRHDSEDLVSTLATFDISSSIVRPTTSGSPPKLRRHSPSLNTTTRSRPATSFSAVKGRPMAGRTRSTSKKEAVTRSGTRDCGSAPGSRSVSQPLAIAAIDSNTCCSATQSM